MAAIDLTTASAVQTYGGLTANALPALGPLVTACSQLFMTLTERSDYIAAQTANEIREGAGTDSLMLAHYPVVSVQSVQIDTLVLSQVTVFPPSSTPGLGSGPVFLVDLNTGLIKFIGGKPCRGSWIQVQYTYGFATVPLDVVQAVNEMVLFLFKRRDHLDQQTATLAAQVVKYMDMFPDEIKKVIRYYKRTRRISGNYSL